MNSILKIENLTYKNILNNISLSLEEGSFNIITGANGSGKTTLIYAILGLLKYEGNIIFLNQLLDGNNIDELRKNIGVLLDNTNSLLPGNVLFNITYPLLNLKYTDEKAKKSAYEISKKLGINNLLLKDIEKLSISQKKMVSLAVSLVHNPKLIMIDDSLDELDDQNRKRVIKYLKGLDKSTILFVTNKENDIIFADNLIIMNNGKISVQGKVREIINNEKNFVKNNVQMPFLVELSHKLKSYDLIKDMFLDYDEMVNAIWK